MYTPFLMDGDFEIVKTDVYLDGGTKSFEFNDGIVIYQDNRLVTESRGSFFHGYPEHGNMILLYGDRRRLIKEVI